LKTKETKLEELALVDGWFNQFTAKLKFKTFNVIIEFEDNTSGGKYRKNSKGYIVKVFRTSNGFNWTYGFYWLTKSEISALEKVGVEMSKLKTDKQKGEKLFNYAPKSFYNQISKNKDLERLSKFIYGAGRIRRDK